MWVVSIGLCAAVASFGCWADSPPLGENMPAAPALLAAPPACGVRGQQAAGRRAAQLERSARARWERAPFHPADGARAVQDLRGALACYRAASDRVGVARVAVPLKRWERQLRRRYREAQLRLHLALQAGDAQAVGTGARRLRALLAEAGAEGEAYVAWLGALERRARARTAARKRGGV